MLHRNLESSLHVVTLAKSYVNVTRGYTLGVTCSEGVWVCVSLDGAEVYGVVLSTDVRRLLFGRIVPHGCMIPRQPNGSRTFECYFRYFWPFWLALRTSGLGVVPWDVILGPYLNPPLG